MVWATGNVVVNSTVSQFAAGPVASAATVTKFIGRAELKEIIVKRQLALVAIIMSMIPASVAIAHPGHGHNGGTYNLVHYLTEPVHLATVLGTLVASFLVMMLLRGVVRPLRKTLA